MAVVACKSRCESLPAPAPLSQVEARFVGCYRLPIVSNGDSLTVALYAGPSLPASPYPIRLAGVVGRHHEEWRLSTWTITRGDSARVALFYFYSPERSQMYNLILAPGDSLTGRLYRLMGAQEAMAPDQAVALRRVPCGAT